MDEHHHLALPKLYGAPAYARAVPQVITTSRPFDPDDLPLVAEMSEEDQDEFGAALDGNPPSGPDATVRSEASLRPRPFSLRRLADRLRRSSR
ncbi:MAG: hypothetical protein HW391_111 [Chloroflexi bacterium]|nr:hypothetical protein [Chloroflexota bacterium]